MDETRPKSSKVEVIELLLSSVSRVTAPKRRS